MLTFHRAAPAAQWAEPAKSNFYLNLDYLDRLLWSLKRDGWEIVTVEELTGGLERGEDGSRLVNFSVDDCYRDTFEHVVPLFRRHGVPVTLFVTTGIPDGTMSLGWAGLEDDPGAAGPRIYRQARPSMFRRGAAKQQWFAKIAQPGIAAISTANIEASAGPTRPIPEKLREEHAITWEMLEKLAGDPLVEIGAHTVSHPSVSALPPDRAMQDLAGSRDRLRSQPRHRMPPFRLSLWPERRLRQARFRSGPRSRLCKCIHDPQGARSTRRKTSSACRAIR